MGITMTGHKVIGWKSEYWIMLALLLFFGGLLAVFGVQEFPDSETYIRMYLGREPVYPLFLLVNRTVFGGAYKLVTAILQGLLAAYSIYILVCYIRKTFGLNWLGTGFITFLFIGPHLLTPLGAASHMVYTNSILSEGIGYSIFNLMVFFLLRLVLEEKKCKKDYILSLGMALLLSLTRGQMMPMLLVWGCVAAFASVVSNIGKKRVVQVVLVILITTASFGIRSSLMFAYNYGVKNVAAVNLGSGTTFLTNVIYSADADDGKQIQNEGIQNTFYYIQEKVEAAGWNYQAAAAGLIEQALHLEECHDAIKFNQIELFITWYLNDYQGLDGRAREVQTDEVAMTMAKEVLPQCFERWIMVYFSLAVVGFIRTVAVIHPMLNVFALILYIISAILMLYLFYKKRGSRGAQCMLLVFLLVFANVLATSMTIMCLSRYMIYNMSLFYVADFLMLFELINMKEIKIRNKTWNKLLMRENKRRNED